MPFYILNPDFNYLSSHSSCYICFSISINCSDWFSFYSVVLLMVRYPKLIDDMNPTACPKMLLGKEHLFFYLLLLICFVLFLWWLDRKGASQSGTYIISTKLNIFPLSCMIHPWSSCTYIYALCVLKILDLLNICLQKVLNWYLFFAGFNPC